MASDDSMDMRFCKPGVGGGDAGGGVELVMDRQAWHATVLGVAKSWM